MPKKADDTATVTDVNEQGEVTDGPIVDPLSENPPNTSVDDPSIPVPAPVIIAIGSGDPRLPGGLHLGVGLFFAELLPDGRAVVQDLPASIRARYYPDLAPLAVLPPAPTILTEV